MRILCVGTAYPPLGSGGYELQCAGAVAHLREHGHEVRVLTAAAPAGAAAVGADADAGLFRELRAFPAAPEPDPSPARALAAEAHNAAVLARHLDAFGPDAVCWWRLGELSVSLPGRVRAAGLPAVGMVCDPWWLDAPARDPWARLTGAGLDRDAAAWLFVSRALREQVGGDGPVLHAGIDLPRLPLAPPRAWEGQLLYAGRLSPLKGVEDAVRALALLPGSASLRLVGDGEPGYTRALRALAGELGVADRVAFEPARPPEAMAGAYAAADAVLFPSRWAEPWGLVPLEAMACGRPVVATGTGGSAEYLRDWRNTLLAPPGEPAALAAAVGRLAESPELRDRLRAEGRATAERHPAERSHAGVRRALETAAADPVPTSRLKDRRHQPMSRL